MSGGRLYLTGPEAAALQQAFAQLQAGDVAGALATARRVRDAAPGAPDANHFLALCLRRLGDLDGALAALEQALRAAPQATAIRRAYAATLRTKGATERAVAAYRACLAAEPDHGETWMGLALALLDAGRAAEAVAAGERACALSPRAAPMWRALGAARREAGDLAGAEAALRQAVALAPADGAGWTALGVVQRLSGDPEAALRCYAEARSAGYDGPELADAEASARLDVGDVDAARAQFRALTERAPGYLAAHEALAEILWEHGGEAGEEDPLAAFRAAAANRPRDASLQAAFARALIRAGQAAEALGVLEALRRWADQPAFAAAHAEALSALERSPEAAALLEALPDGLRAHPIVRTALARHLLQLGRPQDAAREAEAAAWLSTPYDQAALALLSTAWRLLEDPRELWLCDYERLVMPEAIAPPPGFQDINGFLQALAQTLTRLHAAQREPIRQSLRGGTQTSGNLFGRPDPLIVAAREALTAAALRALARLPEDPRHPFLSRRAEALRVVGSWSVRLRRAGRHVSHYHQEGWLSSAFYVALPPSVRAGDGEAGAIHFGQPPEELGLGLAPRRIVRPQPGLAVFFPSYIWHGTTPFDDAEPRLTIAFDAQPA